MNRKYILCRLDVKFISLEHGAEWLLRMVVIKLIKRVTVISVLMVSQNVNG